MKILMFFLFSCNCVAATAISKNNEYQVRENEASKKLIFKEFAGLELSDGCFKSGKQPKCAAYEMASNRIALTGDGSKYIGNPASNYCKSMNGTSAIAKAKDNSETDVCRFKDGSYVKSWSAYYKHYPNTPIKK